MKKNYVAQADEKYYFETYGSEEEISENNFYIPEEEDYVFVELDLQLLKEFNLEK